MAAFWVRGFSARDSVELRQEAHRREVQGLRLNTGAACRDYFGGLPAGALAGLTIPCSKFFSLEMVQISSPMSQGFNL